MENDVTFTGEAVQQRVVAQKQPRGLYKLVIKTGLAKDEKGAAVVLIVIALVAIALAIALPFLA